MPALHAAPMPVQAPPNRFLSECEEKAEFNQYWYSAGTLRTLVEGSELRQNSCLFDFDGQFATTPGFVPFDFQQPVSQLPGGLLGTFDAVVIDPPFITAEVWEQYALAANLLLAKGGKVLLSTTPENADLLWRRFGAKPQVFQPSIPHLVYQYSFFCNYPSKLLSLPNPEVTW